MLRQVFAFFCVVLLVTVVVQAQEPLTKTTEDGVKYGYEGEYDIDNLPLVYVLNKEGQTEYALQNADETDEEPLKDAALEALQAKGRRVFKVGHRDIHTWVYKELNMPPELMDVDGGTIRLIMQHETDPNDQIRVIDEHIAMERPDNEGARWGAHGRKKGRYGWTRQSGGGDLSWILGDNTPHKIAAPWRWAYIVDYNWLHDSSPLGGNKIRIYSHPLVTTRVVIMD